MADQIKKIEMRERGDGTYNQLLYPKTSDDMVIMSGGGTLQSQMTNINNNLDVKVSSRASQDTVNTINSTVNTINTNVGRNSDAASASGSLHAKIKDLQNRIGAGAGIKSVQRGLTVLAGPETTERIVNISNVDMNKTFISHSLSYVNSSTDTSFRPAIVAGMSATVELRSASSLIIKKDGGFDRSHELRVSWEVIEFN